MIVSKTPLRISLVGGGSDLQSFYKHEPGAVISASIDKYMYVAVSKKFDNKIHVSYSKTEIVDKLSKLKHTLARESLIMMGIKNGIEIFPICDIPAGSGLGTSAAYTVGLLNDLYAYVGKNASGKELAKKACIVEIQKAKREVGKQDQYAVALGGLNLIRFNPDETVEVKKIKLSSKKMSDLENNLLLLYTGRTGLSTKILDKQNKKTNTKKDILRKMVKITYTLKKELEAGNIDFLGKALHENWLLKKQLASNISDKQIDNWYDIAIKNGALGGKICGAGGRGFMLLYAHKKYHRKITSKLSSLQNINFSFEANGSSIVYNDSK